MRLPHRARVAFATPALLVAACAAPATPPLSECVRVPPSSASARADYRVRLLDPAERAVAVEMKLSGLDPAARELALTLPDGYSFLRLEEPLLAAPLTARGRDGAPLELRRDAPYRWTLATGGATEATVSWTGALTAHDRADVAERDAFGHPYVKADHALLHTGALLVAPAIACEHRVRFEGPADWPVLCPWRAAEDGAYDPGSTQALQHDLVALGDWSRRAIELDGMTIEVGIAPGQPALAALAVPAIEKICAAELELFAHVPRERYLFLFVAPKPVTGFAFAGSPKTGAMVLQVCGDLASPIAGEMIAHLVAHEFHHLWAVSRLDFGDDLRFVGEGFTDWYAHLVPARLGLVTWERFGAELGEKLGEWNALRPALDATLVEAGGPRFFEGRAHYEATYKGGLLVAALLDLELRRAGRVDGLDGWLRELVNDARWSAGARGPGVEDFLAHVERALGPARRELVARWISTPHGFDPEKELALLGVGLMHRTTPRQLRANFDGTRITALDRASEAARLGLREGDVVRGVNGRDVADARAVQAAWAEPIEGRVEVRVERDGALHELRASAEPAIETIVVDAAPWSG